MICLSIRVLNIHQIWILLKGIGMSECHGWTIAQNVVSILDSVNLILQSLKLTNFTDFIFHKHVEWGACTCMFLTNVLCTSICNTRKWALCLQETWWFFKPLKTTMMIVMSIPKNYKPMRSFITNKILKYNF